MRPAHIAPIVAVVLVSVINPQISSAQNASQLARMPKPVPVKAEQAELGRHLFFDARLSGDGSLSCATCHDPARGFSDGKALSEAYPGARHFRNTLPAINAGHRKLLFWDGRMYDLADLVRDHITDAQFMNADGRLVIERLRQVPEYEEGFKKALGGEPSFGRILNAVAAYLKTLQSKDDPLDRALAGDEAALGPDARRGLDLFAGKAGCVACHNGPLLTDEAFHALGVPANKELFEDPLRQITLRRFFKSLGSPGYTTIQDPGLFAITKRPGDRFKFRTPSLREVGRRSAFMHDGAFTSLEQVVDFYDRGGGPVAGKDPFLKPLGLSAPEKRDLVAFLSRLASPHPPDAAAPEKLEYRVRKLGQN